MTTFALFVLGVFVASMTAHAATPDSKRPYQVSDTVQMSYFGTVAASAPDDLDTEPVQSPDGLHFAAITHRGELPSGNTVGTIWLFENNTVIKSISDLRLPITAPVPLAHMSAAVNGAYGLNVLDDGNTITELRWAANSQSLTFLGRDGKNNRQLFSLDTGSRQVLALTPITQDVIAYARQGNTFVYLVAPNADLQTAQAWVSAGPDIADEVIGTGTCLMPLLYPHFKGNQYSEPVELEIWKVSVGEIPTPVREEGGPNPVNIETRYTASDIFLSPDRQQLVTIGVEPGRHAPQGVRATILSLPQSLDRPHDVNGEYSGGRPSVWQGWPIQSGMDAGRSVRRINRGNVTVQRQYQRCEKVRCRLVKALNWRVELLGDAAR